jgi:hypothetical protein
MKSIKWSLLSVAVLELLLHGTSLDAAQPSDYPDAALVTPAQATHQPAPPDRFVSEDFDPTPAARYDHFPTASENSSRWKLFDELSLLAAIDGTKQPQEFGVNAHVGGQGSMNWGLPLLPDWGVGLQVGTGVTATANAVRVYELLGESTGRTQSYTTLGLFQRTDSGYAWGFVHDFLAEDYYDEFSLSQWRIRGSRVIDDANEIGVTAMLRSRGDSGVFGNATVVQLDPIDQAHVYWRKYWSTSAQTTFWLGLAEGHGENNAVTGPSPAKDEQFLFGADVLMPLSASLALYGETNMIMPTDTGTVDAFLGIQWYPTGRAFCARRGTFSPLMSLASPVSFAVDLAQ